MRYIYSKVKKIKDLKETNLESSDTTTIHVRSGSDTNFISTLFFQPWPREL